jgi:hypothetical protein
MKARAVWVMVFTFAIVLFLGASAEAQLPKKGTYSGKFGWWAVGNLHDIDKNHVFWMGQFSGTFFNDAGSGFMDHISLLCPGVNDIVNGESMSAHGYCTGTDKDGDKLFYVWQGEKFVGTFQFTGGTGKYTGLKGNNSWRGYSTGSTANGYTEFTGEWQLPD